MSNLREGDIRGHSLLQAKHTHLWASLVVRVWLRLSLYCRQCPRVAKLSLIIVETRDQSNELGRVIKANGKIVEYYKSWPENINIVILEIFNKYQLKLLIEDKRLYPTIVMKHINVHVIIGSWKQWIGVSIVTRPTLIQVRYVTLACLEYNSNHVRSITDREKYE